MSDLGRRSFLKLLGFGSAAAAIGATHDPKVIDKIVAELDTDLLGATPEDFAALLEPPPPPRVVSCASTAEDYGSRNFVSGLRSCRVELVVYDIEDALDILDLQGVGNVGRFALCQGRDSYLVGDWIVESCGVDQSVDEVARATVTLIATGPVTRTTYAPPDVPILGGLQSIEWRSESIDATAYGGGGVSHFDDADIDAGSWNGRLK